MRDIKQESDNLSPVASTAEERQKNLGPAFSPDGKFQFKSEEKGEGLDVTEVIQRTMTPQSPEPLHRSESDSQTINGQTPPSQTPIRSQRKLLPDMSPAALYKLKRDSQKRNGEALQVKRTRGPTKVNRDITDIIQRTMTPMSPAALYRLERGSHKINGQSLQLQPPIRSPIKVMPDATEVIRRQMARLSPESLYRVEKASQEINDCDREDNMQLNISKTVGKDVQVEDKNVTAECIQSDTETHGIRPNSGTQGNRPNSGTSDGKVFRDQRHIDSNKALLLNLKNLIEQNVREVKQLRETKAAAMTAEKKQEKEFKEGQLRANLAINKCEVKELEFKGLVNKYPFAVVEEELGRTRAKSKQELLNDFNTLRLKQKVFEVTIPKLEREAELKKTWTPTTPAITFSPALAHVNLVYDHYFGRQFIFKRVSVEKDGVRIRPDDNALATSNSVVNSNVHVNKDKRILNTSDREKASGVSTNREAMNTFKSPGRHVLGSEVKDTNARIPILQRRSLAAVTEVGRAKSFASYDNCRRGSRLPVPIRGLFSQSDLKIKEQMGGNRLLVGTNKECLTDTVSKFQKTPKQNEKKAFAVRSRGSASNVEDSQTKIPTLKHRRFTVGSDVRQTKSSAVQVNRRRDSRLPVPIRGEINRDDTTKEQVDVNFLLTGANKESLMEKEEKFKEPQKKTSSVKPRGSGIEVKGKNTKLPRLQQHSLTSVADVAKTKSSAIPNDWRRGSRLPMLIPGGIKDSEENIKERMDGRHLLVDTSKERLIDRVEMFQDTPRQYGQETSAVRSRDSNSNVENSKTKFPRIQQDSVAVVADVTNAKNPSVQDNSRRVSRLPVLTQGRVNDLDRKMKVQTDGKPLFGGASNEPSMDKAGKFKEKPGKTQRNTSAVRSRDSYSNVESSKTKFPVLQQDSLTGVTDVGQAKKSAIQNKRERESRLPPIRGGINRSDVKTKELINGRTLLAAANEKPLMDRGKKFKETPRQKGEKNAVVRSRGSYSNVENSKIKLSGLNEDSLTGVIDVRQAKSSPIQDSRSGINRSDVTTKERRNGRSLLVGANKEPLVNREEKFNETPRQNRKKMSVVKSRGSF